MFAPALFLLLAANQPVVVENWTHGFYFPASAPEGSRIPLVVFLHGCQQFRWHAEATTRLYDWAEKEGFAVLMPEQSRLRNPWKCWNWFLGDDEREMDEIVELTQEYQAKFPLLKTRTYVMGLSAGGVMTAHLLACRPDVFRAGAVFAGAAYGMVEFSTEEALSLTSSRSRAELAEHAWRCMAKRTPAEPVSVLVVHGGKDRISRPRNGEQVAAQFAGANHLLVRGRPGFDLSLVPVGEERFAGPGHAWTRTRFASVDKARVELVRIEGLGHAWSGGPRWLPFSDDEGPDGTLLALQFLGLVGPE